MGGTFEGRRVQPSFLKEQGYLKLRQDKGEDTDEEQTRKKKDYNDKRHAVYSIIFSLPF